MKVRTTGFSGREMFSDFGSALPGLTTLVITYQYLWLGLGLFGPGLANGARSGKGNACLRLSLFASAGIIECVLAQTILFARLPPPRRAAFRDRGALPQAGANEVGCGPPGANRPEAIGTGAFRIATSR